MSDNDTKFFVFLIDSVEKEDEDVVRHLRGACDLCEIPVQVVKAKTKRGLNLALNRFLRDEFQKRQVLPIIHIVSHGFSEERPGGGGLAIAGSDSVDWVELGLMLEAAMQVRDGIMPVLLTACKGARGGATLKGVTKAMNVIAPVPATPWSDSAVGCAAFYKVFERTDGNVREAVCAMNASCGYGYQRHLPFSLMERTAEDDENLVKCGEAKQAKGLVNEYPQMALQAQEGDDALCYVVAASSVEEDA